MSKPSIKFKKKSIKSIGRGQPKEQPTPQNKQIHDQFEQLVQQSSEPMLLLEPSGQIQFVNAAFCLLTGHEAAKIIGQPVQQYCATALETLYPQNGTFPDPIPSQLNVELVSADEKVHWAEISPSIVVWEDGPAMLWALNRNTIKNQVREQYQTKLFTNNR